MSRLPPLEPCYACHILGVACDFHDMRATLVNQDPTQSGVTVKEQYLGVDLNAITKYLNETPQPQPASTRESGLLYTPNSKPRAEVVGIAPIVNVHRTYAMTKPPQNGPSASTPTTVRQKVEKIKVPCPAAPCEWLDDEGRACGALISCEGVPVHFKIHGIERMKDDDRVSCRWSGCFADFIRKNFARHIRQCHLHHIRGKGHEQAE